MICGVDYMRDNKKIGSSGFTLIELLATISILAVLAYMAVPNVVGVTEKNKNKTYVEDAKRMISLAEYRVNSDTKYKPSSYGDSGAICLMMEALGNSNFSTDKGKAPNGGTYDMDKSYVRIIKKKNADSSFSIDYYVQLTEKKDNSYFGVKNVSKEELYDKSVSNLVSSNKNSSFFGGCSGNKVIASSTDNQVGGNTYGYNSIPNYGS